MKWAILAALLCASLICSCVLAARTPQAPRALTISPCREVPSTMHRIAANLPFPDAIEFDVPETDFVVESGTRDMPPGQAHLVTLRGHNERLEISNFELSFEKELVGFPVHSVRVHQSAIRTSDGRKIGEDHWGYFKTGERWRYLRFTSGEEDGYRPMLLKYSNLLDNVISSACLAPVPVGH